MNLPVHQQYFLATWSCSWSYGVTLLPETSSRISCWSGALNRDSITVEVRVQWGAHNTDGKLIQEIKDGLYTSARALHALRTTRDSNGRDGSDSACLQTMRRRRNMPVDAHGAIRIASSRGDAGDESTRKIHQRRCSGLSVSFSLKQIIEQTEARPGGLISVEIND
jgi:hypothetical protein